MKSKLFEFVLVHVPTDKKEKILPILEDSLLLAKDENEARMKAARLIPSEFADDLDQIEIVIRPF